MKLDRSLVYGLLASIFMVSVPHVEHLPPWVTALCAMLIAWRTYLNFRDHPLPPRWMLFFLSTATVGGIFLTYHTLFGRDAGVTLLILLASLKLLELRAARDATVLIYLTCFIIITNFFYSQSIPTALMMFASLLVILTTWVHLHSGGLSLKPRLNIAAKLLLQAIPLTLLLFVLFPRVQGPLWGLPHDAHASSGLSDSMSPGTLSKLSLSQAVAFRVNFEGGSPPRDQMYWRGPVLWDFDGLTWKNRDAVSPNKGITANEVTVRNKTPQFDKLDRPVDYTVTLEPHNKKWLFALDMPTKVSITDFMTDDFQIQAREPITARLRYSVQSQLVYRANVDEAPLQLNRALMLPPELNPRAHKLAAAWRTDLSTDDAIIRTAISHFNSEGFVYTLEPPLLGLHGVDDFLFASRKGFCEHYASSFVFLMRAAGIPARVVTGYQGGEPNEFGGYTIVRQSDAHAWAEVWLKDRGWIRVDPTAAVSPERVQGGLNAAIPDSPALPFLARTQLPWLMGLRFNLDMLNHQWNQWVLGYDTERQFGFLTRLGMEDITWQKMAINLLIGVGLLIVLISIVLLRKLHGRKTDAALGLYLKFCKKLAKAGVSRAAHEGPQDFANRAVTSLPHLAKAIHNITAQYMAMRYENNTDSAGLRGLRREIAAFKL